METTEYLLHVFSVSLSVVMIDKANETVQN